jgi:hypothetical protein
VVADVPCELALVERSLFSGAECSTIEVDGSFNSSLTNIDALLAVRFDTTGSDGFATSGVLGGSAAGKPVSCCWGVMGGCTAFEFRLMIDIP